MPDIELSTRKMIGMYLLVTTAFLCASLLPAQSQVAQGLGPKVRFSAHQLARYLDDARLNEGEFVVVRPTVVPDTGEVQLRFVGGFYFFRIQLVTLSETASNIVITCSTDRCIDSRKFGARVYDDRLTISAAKSDDQPQLFATFVYFKALFGSDPPSGVGVPISEEEKR